MAKTLAEPYWTEGFDLAGYLRDKQLVNREVATELGISEPSLYSYLKKNSVPYAVFRRLEQRYGAGGSTPGRVRRFPSKLPVELYQDLVGEPQTQDTEFTGAFRDTIRAILDVVGEISEERTRLRQEVQRLTAQVTRLQTELDSTLRVLDEQTSPTPNLTPLPEVKLPKSVREELDAVLGKSKGPR